MTAETPRTDRPAFVPALNVIDGGNREGAPVVLLHGFMSSRYQWELNLERLGAHYRTIIIELPGHGNSPVPDDPAGYAPAAVLPAIDQIRRSLGVDDWWVVGHSMGGAVGIRYALEYPDHTLGLVFTNSRAVFGISRGEGAARPEPLRPTSAADLRRLPFHPVHAKRFPTELQRKMIDVADAMAPSVITDLGAAASAWRSREELDRLAMPVLLVNGVWEKAFQPHVAEALDAVADIRVVDLEGGHSINIEQPEQFDAAVISFIGDERRP